MEEQNDSIGRIGAVGSAELASAHEGAAGSPFAASPDAARSPYTATPVKQAGSKGLEGAVSQVNDHLSPMSRVLELSVDPASGLSIATIKNSQTGAVIQQFPGTDIVHLARMLEDWSHGKNALLDLMA